jgi:hypothetical protein
VSCLLTAPNSLKLVTSGPSVTGLLKSVLLVCQSLKGSREQFMVSHNSLMLLFNLLVLAVPHFMGSS